MAPRILLGCVLWPAALVAQAASPPTPIESLPPRPALSAETQSKLARMEPLFDGRTLNGWIQAPTAPFRFAREDVADPAMLGRVLGDPANEVARVLVARFDEAGKTALLTLRDAGAPSAAVRDAVAAVLRNVNRLGAEPQPIFEDARPAGVMLRAETEALRGSARSGLALARLNRMLVEDAFPTAFARSPSSGWIVKGGAMASTGAGRGSIYTEQDFSHYRLVFQVRQISGNHVPGVLVFCARPATRGDLAEAQAGIDALGAIQLQVPNGGHWDYRPGVNKAGAHFTRPVRIRFDLHAWAQVEVLVNARTGVARMAVAQPVGTRAIEILGFHDPAAGRAGPIALQMHNAGLFDEFRDLKIEVNPKEDRLLTVE